MDDFILIYNTLKPDLLVLFKIDIENLVSNQFTDILKCCDLGWLLISPSRTTDLSFTDVINKTPDPLVTVVNTANVDIDDQESYQ